MKRQISSVAHLRLNTKPDENEYKVSKMVTTYKIKNDKLCNLLFCSDLSYLLCSQTRTKQDKAEYNAPNTVPNLVSKYKVNSETYNLYNH